jgi:hypothetical protein
MFQARLLCESAIDVIIDLCDLVGRVDSDGRAFALFYAGEACHDVVYYLFPLQNTV